MLRRITGVLVLVVLVGCGAPPQTSGPPDGDFAVVTTYFATDRDLTGEPDPKEMFGVDRGELRYGFCDVSIPRDHRMGELESPSIWRLEFREDPEKHVVLLTADVESLEGFYDRMQKELMHSERRGAFVFVHGYNVSFENAARRTAQMAYDLAFDGVPVFYSWPSQNKLSAYTVDEQNIEWAQSHMRTFLEDFLQRSSAENVYLIAHSMGNRGLARALADLLEDHPEYRHRLTEVILAAPDIDADVFVNDIAPALIDTLRMPPVTLYASSGDKALEASRKVHGSPRAGDSGSGLIIFEGIETVDASAVDTSFLGHSYFAESRSALSDMYYLIRNGERANQRFGLRPVDSEGGLYWVFKD